MREKVFNTEIKNSLLALGHWAHKIGDQPIGKQEDGGQSHDGFRFNIKKPFDIIAVICGRGVAIEGKMIRRFQAFGQRDIRDIQKENLDKMLAAGGRAFVFLNVRGVIAGRRENRCIIFDWAEFREVQTIPHRVLQTLPFIPGAHGLFDLHIFCEIIRVTPLNFFDL